MWHEVISVCGNVRTRKQLDCKQSWRCVATTEIVWLLSPSNKKGMFAVPCCVFSPCGFVICVSESAFSSCSTVGFFFSGFVVFSLLGVFCSDLLSPFKLCSLHTSHCSDVVVACLFVFLVLLSVIFICFLYTSSVLLYLSLSTFGLSLSFAFCAFFPLLFCFL